MKYIIILFRIIVGLLFIFSGVVKANDPLGLTYKMNEFFEVWDMNFMLSYTLGLSICMIAFEIIAGVAMLVGNYFRLYITLLLLLNIFYTFLTGYALYSGKIKECGCFGDCIPLSNTVTFYKDVALSVMCLFLYIYRYRVFPVFNKSAINFSIVFAAAIVAFGGQWWTLHHGPIHDCLPYKVGNNILEKMQPSPDAVQPVYETIFIYKKNGIKKEFTTENYPWKDPSWTFVDRKDKLIKEGTGQPVIHDFSLTDSAGTDQTQAIMAAKGYVFLWFLREPEKANTDNMDRLRELITKAEALHIPFYMVCSADPEICNTYKEAWNIREVPFMMIDGTVSKTAMRTNPGLMLMRDGVVQHKWSYMDYPKDMSLDNGTLNFK
jgi:uncharacterized membrane protein YphA (DoxX/SURF4 family)